MAIDLYCSLRSPPSRSVLLLARALDVQLNLKKISFEESEHLAPEFIKINPQHCIPTIVDNGFALWESRAILSYLVTTYGKDDKLYPKDAKKRAIVDQRLYFDIGTLFPRIRQCFLALRSGGKPDADNIAKINEALELLDKFLDGQQWVAGSDITIADYAIAVTLSVTSVVNIDISKYTNITKWFERVQKTIEGFSELQEEGNAELLKMIPSHAPDHK
ncbi:glutathione S-transferase D4-like isoform X1 [Periplaneta americana]|uniref:glutathione S-transferase D4-like isoform X1 n=1 Tax=Periplaneta americana TaxID=6978 RepID=UPI0037E96F5B